MVEGRPDPGQYGIIGFVRSPETLSDDIAALQTALTAERAARQQAEARASGAEAMVAYLKLLIAKMKRERFGQWPSVAASCSTSWNYSSRSWKRVRQKTRWPPVRARRTPPQCT